MENWILIALLVVIGSAFVMAGISLWRESKDVDKTKDPYHPRQNTDPDDLPDPIAEEVNNPK